MSSELKRAAEQWEKCDPKAMARMSEAAIMYALADAKSDVLRMHAEIKTLRAALAAGQTTAAQADVVPVRQYYYKVDQCPAGSSSDPTCICWHAEGTGPLANEPETIKSWRPSPQAAQPAHSGEPVALTLASHDAGEAGCCMFSRFVPGDTQLYTAPQLVERGSTPEAQVFELLRWVNSLDALAVWRAAEAAHGITQKGGQHGPI